MSTASTGEPRIGETQPGTQSDVAPRTLPATSTQPPAPSSTTRPSTAAPHALSTACDEDATPPGEWSLEQIRAHMTRPDSADTGATAASDTAATTKALYDELWPFVFQLLPSYGVYGP